MKTSRNNNGGNKRIFTRFMQEKLAVTFLVTMLALFGLVVVLYQMIEENNEDYTQIVLRQHSSYDSRTLPYRRGDIVDRNGTYLATSEMVYNLIIDPNQINQRRDNYLEPTVTALCEVFGYDRTEITNLINENADSYYIPYEKQLSMDQKEAFEAKADEMNEAYAASGSRNRVKGVWFEQEYRRVYPYNSLACNVVGFSFDNGKQGSGGIEQYYNDQLIGTNGREYGYLDDESNMERVIKPAENGNTIVSTIDAPSFIFYLVILYSVINPLKEFSKAGYNIPKGLASMERIDKILLAENPIKESTTPKSLPGLEHQIEFRDITFSYDGRRQVLKHVNLTIPRGKTIALVGQSGSGKSTLVDLLPRYHDVQQGEILIDGVNIKDVRIHDLRALIGNVNQEAILFNDTFFNNIAFGVENATMEQVVAAAKIANAHDFIMETPDGYNTNIGDRGGKLSGGQRQRISIARAILKNPPILILDEATSALDTESERLVQEALERLMKTRTTIAIAHRLSTIRGADEICVLHDGEIVERGRHEELLALGGYYKRLNDMQNN